MNALDLGLAQARDVASALVGAAANVSQLQSGGRNSRIYRVQSTAGNFALKRYPSRQDDPRDRLSTEVGALRLMERYRVDNIPRVIGVDSDRGYALLSWIDGREVLDVSDADIDAASAFLTVIHSLRTTSWAAEQPQAAEACLSGGEIERQLGERLKMLRKLSTDVRDLFVFLEDSFAPELDRRIAQARSAIRSAGLDFAAELPQEWRSLVPSDFGFHNSLRRVDGTLAFIDFEYFGWDDPVKMTADILLHPGRALTLPQRRRFQEAALRLYGEDHSFAARLEAYLPLFGLRWVLIILNEFVPERWRRRVLAGATENWTDAKTRQLGVAKKFLASLSQKGEG